MRRFSWKRTGRFRWFYYYSTRSNLSELVEEQPHVVGDVAEYLLLCWCTSDPAVEQCSPHVFLQGFQCGVIQYQLCQMLFALERYCHFLVSFLLSAFCLDRSRAASSSSSVIFSATSLASL